MGQRNVERLWNEYLTRGRVVIGTSTTKSLLGMIGMALLCALGLGMAFDAYTTHGMKSFRLWACALVALICAVGIFATAHPMVLRRRAVLEAPGFYAETNRRGTWNDEFRVRWEDVRDLGIHRNTGNGTTTVTVRFGLVPDAMPRYDRPFPEGYGDMPTQLSVSKMDLAKLMERIRTYPTGR